MINGDWLKYYNLDVCLIVVLQIWVIVMILKRLIYKNIDQRLTKAWKIYQNIKRMEYGQYLVFNMDFYKVQRIWILKIIRFHIKLDILSIKLYINIQMEDKDSLLIKLIGLIILVVMG